MTALVLFVIASLVCFELLDDEPPRWEHPVWLVTFIVGLVTAVWRATR